jgi:hypothetical protein
MPVVPTDQLSSTARRLAALIEPLAGQVYFSPECHRGYAALGFAPSRMKAGAVELPDGPAYFTSRGSVMGQVHGDVVAAAFAVFNPAAVVPAVTYGWSLTDAATICAARDAGAIAQLVRLLGPEPAGIDRALTLVHRMTEPLRPEGKPLYAGLRALGFPGTPMGDLWRGLDLLREFRGDAHTAAWTAVGVDAVEIWLLTELFIGLPLRSYIRTRAWSDDDLDAATERLVARGWLNDERTGFSPAGRAARAAIEDATDAQMAPAINVLSADAGELLGLLAPWGAAVRQGGGYLAGGADDLARPASPA